MKPTLKQIAKVSRKQIEKFAEKYEDAGGGDDLAGYCGIASRLLSDVAQHFGYALEVVAGSTNGYDYCCHSWTIDFETETVYDITARQFNMKLPKVYIVKYGKDKLGYDIMDKGRRQVFTDWPPEQSPIRQYRKLKPFIQQAIDDLT